MDSLLGSVRQHKKFKALAAYSMACVTKAITPPTDGWRENLKEVIQKDGVKAITEVIELHPGDNTILQAASGSLSLIANAPEAAESIAASGALTHLSSAAAAESAEPETVSNVARMLEQVANQAPASFVKSDGAGAVRSLMQRSNASQDRFVVASCARSLEKASRAKGGVQALADSGAIETVTKVLTTTAAEGPAAAADGAGRETAGAGAGDCNVMGPSLKLLDRMCRVEENADRMRHTGGVDALVETLEKAKTDGRTMRVGGRLLTKVAGANVGEVVSSLQSSGGGAQDSSRVVSLLGNLALEEDNADSIVQSGGVQALIDAFQTASTAADKTSASKTLQGTSRALGRLATSDENVDAIVRGGGLGALIAAVDANADQPEVLAAATPALARLASSHDNAARIADEGGVRAVTSALARNPASAEHARGAIAFLDRVLSSGHGAEEVVAAGGVEAVAAAMDHAREDRALQLTGTRTLAALAGAAPTARGAPAGGSLTAIRAPGAAAAAVQRCGAVDLCLRNLSSPTASAGLAATSLSLLARLAAEEGAGPGTEAVLRTDGVQAVVAALERHSGDSRVREAAQGMMAHVVERKTLEEGSADLRRLAGDAGEDGGAVAPETSSSLRSRFAELAAMAAVPGSAQTLVELGAADAAVEALGHVALSLDCADQEAVLEAGTRLVGELVRLGDSATGGDAVGAGAVRAVVQAVKMHPKLRRSVGTAVVVLEELASAGSATLVAAVVEGRGVEACVTALRTNGEDAEVCTAVTGALVALSASGHARTVASKGATRQLLSLLKNRAADKGYEEVVARSLRVLEHVAREEGARAVLAKQGGLPAVTAVMDAYTGVNGSDAILRAGGRVLAQLMGREDVAAQVAEINSLARTPKSTFAEGAATARAAVAMRNLGYVATVGGNAEDVVRSGGGQALLALTAHAQALPESEDRDQAVAAGMASLAHVAERTAMGATAASAVPYVMAETAGANRCGALQCLAALAHDPAAAEKLAAHHGVRRLLGVVATETQDQDALRAALSTLEAVAAQGSTRAHLAAESAASTIVAFLEDSADDVAPEVTAAAVRVLATMAEASPEAAQQIQATRGVEAAVAALKAHCGAPVDGSATDADPLSETAWRVVATAVDGLDVGAESAAAPADVAGATVFTASARVLQAVSGSEEGVRAVAQSGAVHKLLRTANMHKSYASEAAGMAATAAVLTRACEHPAVADRVRADPAAAAVLEAAVDAQVGNSEVAAASRSALRAVRGEEEDVDDATAFQNASEQVHSLTMELNRTVAAARARGESAEEESAACAYTVARMERALRRVGAHCDGEGAVTPTNAGDSMRYVQEAIEAVGAVRGGEVAPEGGTTVPAALAVGVRTMALVAAREGAVTEEQVAGAVPALLHVVESRVEDPAVMKSTAAALSAVARSPAAVEALAHSSCLAAIRTTAHSAAVPEETRQCADTALEALTTAVKKHAPRYTTAVGVNAVTSVLAATTSDAHAYAECISSMAGGEGGEWALLDALASGAYSSVSAASAASTSVEGGAASAAPAPAPMDEDGGSASTQPTAVPAAPVQATEASTPGGDSAPPASAAAAAATVATSAVAGPEASAAPSAQSSSVPFAVQAQIVHVLASRTRADGEGATAQRRMVAPGHLRAVAGVVQQSRAQALAKPSEARAGEMQRMTADAMHVLASAEYTQEATAALDSSGVVTTVVDVLGDAGVAPATAVDCVRVLDGVARQGSKDMVFRVCEGQKAVGAVVSTMAQAAKSESVAVASLQALDSLCTRVGPERAGLDNEAMQAVTMLMRTHAENAEVVKVGGQLVSAMAAHAEDVTGLVEARVDLAVAASADAAAVQEFKAPDGRPYYLDVESRQTTWEPPRAYKAWMDSVELLEKHAASCHALKPETVGACMKVLEERKANDATAQAVARAVAKIGDNSEMLATMATEEGVRSVVAAMRKNPKLGRLQLALAKLVNRFARNDAVKSRVAANGGIEALVQAAQRHAAAEEVVDPVLSALANMAFNSVQNVNHIVRVGGVEAVEKVMQHHPESASVLELALCVLSNLMYGSDENKVLICERCGDEIVHVVRVHYRDIKLFRTALRALGNLSFTDSNVQFIVSEGATACIVAGIREHMADEAAVQMAIEVLGNFAAQDDEEADPAAAAEVYARIHREGGVQIIVEAMQREDAAPPVLIAGMDALVGMTADEETAPLLLTTGVVETTLDVMQRLDWDEELVEHAVSLLQAMSFSEEILEALSTPDAVRALLGALDMYGERADFAANALVPLDNIASDADGCAVIGDQDGPVTFIRLLDKHLGESEVVQHVLTILTRMATLEAHSTTIAEQGTRAVMEVIRKYADAPEMLNLAFQLVGHLAFLQDNLKDIVQHGGVSVIINAILSHPEDQDLMKQCIHTLDNIAMASKEYAAIVTSEGGRMCIKELMHAYHDDPEIKGAAESALLTIDVLESARKEEEFTKRQRHKPARPT